VRHGALRRSSAWANAGKALLTGVVVVALSGISVAAYAALSLYNSADTVELAPPPDPDAVDAGEQSIDGAFSILLVGSDSRQGQSIDDGELGELNDVNMLLHVSEDHQNATVISFPRDLMLSIPSCPGPKGEKNYYPAMSEQQLNTAMMYGGLPCVVRTIEELTGMSIPYAGLIKFDGVIGVTKAIGGVPVCLTEPIVDAHTNLDLKPGMHNISGWTALQFLRTRHGVGDGGDKSRISNQQVFMSSLVRQLRSSETLSNPVKVYGLAKAGIENMQLSSNMASIPFMQALAGTVKDIDLDRVNFVQYPTFQHPYQEGRLTPDYNSGKVLVDVVESGKPFTVTGKGEGVVEDPNAEKDATPSPTPTESPSKSADSESTETTEPPPTALPSNITGQSGSNQTCSGGRTRY